MRTTVDARIPVPIPNDPATGKLPCDRVPPGATPQPCAAYPGAITTAGDATAFFDADAGIPFDPKGGTMYYKTASHRVFDNVLPSLNLRYEITKDMLARLGASRTIGRQNYNAYGSGFGTPACDAGGCKVTGPNPDLEPLTADNLDLSWSWYFAPRSGVSVSVFHSKIEGYAKAGTVGTSTIDLTDPRDNTVKPFFINTSSQQGARIGGLELSYEQPFGTSPRGFTSNVSRARTRVDDGRPMVGPRSGPATRACTSRTSGCRRAS